MDPILCNQSSFLKETSMILIHKTLYTNLIHKTLLPQLFLLTLGTETWATRWSNLSYCPLLLSCCQKSARILVMCRVALSVALMSTWMSSNGNSHRTAQALPVPLWDLGGNQVSSRKSETSVEINRWVPPSAIRRHALWLSPSLSLLVQAEMSLMPAWLEVISPIPRELHLCSNCRTRRSFSLLTEIKSF